MFTGLVEGLGEVAACERRGSGLRLMVRPPRAWGQPAGGLPATPVQLGESIAVNGCCLTVVAMDAAGWSFDVGEETQQRTNLGTAREGDPVNLERALSSTARLGGHFVQGHVDGRGTISSIETSGEWTMMNVSLPLGLARYLVEKGSVCVDGVSLTVVEAGADLFRVMLIPHTLASTTLGRRRVGDAVNIEVDLLAKYVERLLAGRTREPEAAGAVESG
ncbi:MAG: riboflavin synthase [Planctomyces sp.]|nr:riboflavin synthase [Planctomyces sp.]